MRPLRKIHIHASDSPKLPPSSHSGGPDTCNPDMEQALTIVNWICRFAFVFMERTLSGSACPPCHKADTPIIYRASSNDGCLPCLLFIAQWTFHHSPTGLLYICLPYSCPSPYWPACHRASIAKNPTNLSVPSLFSQCSGVSAELPIRQYHWAASEDFAKAPHVPRFMSIFFMIFMWQSLSQSSA